VRRRSLSRQRFDIGRDGIHDEFEGASRMCTELIDIGESVSVETEKVAGMLSELTYLKRDNSQKTTLQVGPRCDLLHGASTTLRRRFSW
jgi:hypothetical protein